MEQVCILCVLGHIWVESTESRVSYLLRLRSQTYYYYLQRTQIEAEAERQFNSAAKTFFLETLTTLKEMYPDGKFGYYEYPMCYANDAHFCSNAADNDDLQVGNIKDPF